MTFTEAKAIMTALYNEADRLSAALNAFPIGPMGLTPDAVKFSPEFRSAKTAYDTAAAKSRKFRSAYSKAFAKEIREEHRIRMAAIPIVNKGDSTR